MKLYTSKVVAAWLGLTERRVRQLRDEGVISEKQPGLYDLQATVTKYITFLRNGSGKINLNDERAGLTRAKREAAEMENKLRMGELHRTQDRIENRVFEYPWALPCAARQALPHACQHGRKPNRHF